MTLTASVSRAPVIQLNPDRADEAGRARASVYASERPDHMHRHTKKKHERAHKHAPGDGSSRARFPPVLSQLLAGLGHTAASCGGKNKKKMRGKWGDGKTEAQIERWW